MAQRYTKIMSNLGQLLTILGPFLKDAKSQTVLFMAGGFVAYVAYADVTDKHLLAVKKIEKNQSEISKLEKQNVQILAALENIQSSMGDIKDTVKKTDERVWRIGTDLKNLKRKVQ